MAASFRPAAPFDTALRLLIPSYETVLGVPKKTYPAPADGELFFGAFRTFGGTEITDNGLYSVEETASIDTWYRPDIKSDCRIAVAETGDVYEVSAAPEDVRMRHQYMRIRVRRITGGA